MYKSCFVKFYATDRYNMKSTKKNVFIETMTYAVNMVTKFVTSCMK